VSGAQSLGGDVADALERVKVPTYVIDSTGVIRWVNRAGMEIVGDVRGRQFTSVVAPEDRRRARDNFARKVVGGASVTDTDVVLVASDGGRVAAEVSSVPLVQGGRVVGVFGQLVHTDEPSEIAPHPHLTPRQIEVLRLLAHGQSTEQIASTLHLSRETVRNHVRRLLKALNVHSRLEAVALAHREALIAS
jgi:PAS domain S-box-containing protein